MRKFLMGLSLLMALIAPASAAEKPFDMEEYTSIDELAAAIASHIPGARSDGGKRSETPEKKIKLAVIPVRTSRDDIVPELVRRLREYGRFDVLDAKKAAAFLKDRQERGAAVVMEMRQAFNLDAVAAIRTYPADGKALFIAKIFSNDDAGPRDTIVALLDLRSGMSPLAETGPVLASARDTGVGAPDLPFPAQHVAVADLDGDGRLEYVFSDGDKLSVYRLEPSGWRTVWVEPAKAGSGSTKHLYLDVADVNGNGKPEIFVTVMRNNKISSTVFEEHDGTYRRIAEMPGFIRILRYPGRGLVLIGQDHDEKRFFAGIPKQYIWTGEEYTAGAAFPLPKDVGLYGFALADLGEAHPLLVSLDSGSRLRVYSLETLIWESQEQYGGAETVALESATDAYSVQQKVAIQGRFFAMDLEGTGKDEIIIPRNVGGTLFGGVQEGELCVMQWTGARLEQKARIQGVPGPILDFQIVRQNDAGLQILALVQTKSGLFSKPGARLITYSLR